MEVDINTDKFTSEDVQDLLSKALPKNGWFIDENIKYVKHLNDYNSIIEDLEFAKECLQELKKIRILEENTKIKKSENLKRVYFTNSVITYARCFNYTKKDGRISIDKKQFKKNFPDKTDLKPDDLIRFHNYIMDLRNKFVAHADKNVFEAKRTYVQFKYKDQYLHSTFANLSVTMFNFDQTQLSNFMVLLDYSIISLKRKTDTLIKKVKNEIGNERLLEIASKIFKND